MCYTNAFAPGGSICWNNLDGKDEDKMTNENAKNEEEGR